MIRFVDAPRAPLAIPKDPAKSTAKTVFVGPTRDKGARLVAAREALAAPRPPKPPKPKRKPKR